MLEQGDRDGQYRLGVAYVRGEGVPKDTTEAVTWYRKAVEQGLAAAQGAVGACYFSGEGVLKNRVEAYKWFLLAAAQGDVTARNVTDALETIMINEEIAEGQKLARAFKPGGPAQAATSSTDIAQAQPQSSGTGFFITDDGYLVTNAHVAASDAQIRLVTSGSIVPAKIVKVDGANDLALLKAEGRFTALPLATSRAVKLGDTVATVGFPNIGLQGFAPKFARGEIASLSGPQDDARFFQISVPLQPGNSGGALVDEHGNAIGIVSAKLSASATLKATGELPENVNYAVKSSFLLGFLESVPEVTAKLKEPNSSDLKFAEVVEKAKASAVLVLVY